MVTGRHVNSVLGVIVIKFLKRKRILQFDFETEVANLFNRIFLRNFHAECLRRNHSNYPPTYFNNYILHSEILDFRSVVAQIQHIFQDQSAAVYKTDNRCQYVGPKHTTGLSLTLSLQVEQ